MQVHEAVILGLVQGLGEFLPISSSAHLIIAPWLFNFPDPGLSFDVALHFGTLISLIAFFYRDWIVLIKAFFTSLRKKRENYELNERLIWFLLLASIPAGVAGLLLEKYAETVFRSPPLIAGMMALFGIILYLLDRHGSKTKKIEQITLCDSLWVGFAQCLALIPGASRSGVTISAGLARKMDRATAARFSFLLSTPIVAGAALLKLPKFFKLGIGSPEIVGIVVSALAGYLSIKYMLYFLRNYSFSVYVIYRFLFAAMIVLVLLLRAVH